jgi:hypothetical protein
MSPFRPLLSVFALPLLGCLGEPFTTGDLAALQADAGPALAASSDPAADAGLSLEAATATIAEDARAPSTPDARPEPAAPHDTGSPVSLYAGDQNVAQLACQPSCAGCCDRSGACHMGDAMAVCGQKGFACVDCVVSGAYCNGNGFCSQDPVNAPDGLCPRSSMTDRLTGQLADSPGSLCDLRGILFLMPAVGARPRGRVLPAEHVVDPNRGEPCHAHREARADRKLALRQGERVRAQRFAQRLPPACSRPEERERGPHVLLLARRQVAHDATASSGNSGWIPSSWIA